MRIVLKFHDITHESYRAWRRSIGRSEKERRAYEEVFLQSIRERLESFDGFPPEATIDEFGFRWWAVTRRIKIQYTLTRIPPLPRRPWQLGLILSWIVKRPIRRVLIVGWLTD